MQFERQKVSGPCIFQGRLTSRVAEWISFSPATRETRVRIPVRVKLSPSVVWGRGVLKLFQPIIRALYVYKEKILLAHWYGMPSISVFAFFGFSAFFSVFQRAHTVGKTSSDFGLKIAPWVSWIPPGVCLRPYHDDNTRSPLGTPDLFSLHANEFWSRQFFEHNMTMWVGFRQKARPRVPRSAQNRKIGKCVFLSYLAVFWAFHFIFSAKSWVLNARLCVMFVKNARSKMRAQKCAIKILSRIFGRAFLSAHFLRT